MAKLSKVSTNDQAPEKNWFEQLFGRSPVPSAAMLQGMQSHQSTKPTHKQADIDPVLKAEIRATFLR